LPHRGRVQLDLTDEEARALLRQLNDTIEADRYPLSPRIRLLRGIGATLPMAPPDPPPPGHDTRGTWPEAGAAVTTV